MGFKNLWFKFGGLFDFWKRSFSSQPTCAELQKRRPIKATEWRDPGYSPYRKSWKTPRRRKTASTLRFRLVSVWEVTSTAWRLQTALGYERSRLGLLVYTLRSSRRNKLKIMVVPSCMAPNRTGQTWQQRLEILY